VTQAHREPEGHPIVTAVVPDHRTPGHVIVDLDGARFASLPRSVVEQLGLRIGHDLSSEGLDRLTAEADAEGAYTVALRLVAARPRAEAELRRRLRDKGHNRDATERAVGRLRERGVLDDTEFVRHFVRVRAARGHGCARLIADLRSRGVDGRLAERLVPEALEEEGADEAAQMRRLAERRIAQLGSLPIKTKRRRIVAYLGRRGYRGSDVLKVLNELL